MKNIPLVALAASGGLVNEDFRRTVVNDFLWAMRLDEQITPDASISLLGTLRPTFHGATKRGKDVKPEQLAGFESPILPE